MVFYTGRTVFLIADYADLDMDFADEAEEYRISNKEYRMGK
jgi:hypothetical protein